MTGEGSSAEDLVQETCLKAYKALETYQAGTSYKAWVFKILVNTFIDTHVRRREPEMVGYDVVLQQEGTRPNGRRHAYHHTDPESSLLYKRLQQDVWREVHSLSTEKRLVVILAVFEGFSYEEIAEIVGCPVGTVRSRLQRGRQELQRHLREYASSHNGSCAPHKKVGGQSG